MHNRADTLDVAQATPLSGEDLLHAQIRLAKRMRSAGTLEACARAVCDVMHAELRIGDGSSLESACALVRCFTTRVYSQLDAELREYCGARLASGESPSPELPCFVLLASAGDEPAWRSRHTAKSHRLIPLPNQATLDRLPMVSELFARFGIRLDDVRPRERGLSSNAARAYDLFHVADAVGNPSIPEQDGFVLRYGVQSVIGFGGPCRYGDMFVVLLFSKRKIQPTFARRLRAVALDVTTNIFRFGERDTFDPARSDVSYRALP